MEKGTILIVEDEERIRMGLEDDLAFEGFTVTAVPDGEQGLALAQEGSFDCIVLDVMLPGIDGFEVCKQLRAGGTRTPVIMLTARDHEADKILGLEIGADDYLTKPFSPRELLARIKALLRRAGHAADEPDWISICRFGDVEVNFEKYVLKKSGHQVHLTAYEFALLRLLAQHRGKVLERDDILDRIWGRDVYVTARTIDTHIAHLRKKLEPDPANPRFLVSVHGVGYRFVTDAEQE
ncbi:response regulator transcription factor [bacterium]|nr:response regulator transcription factor [bacterium]